MTTDKVSTMNWVKERSGAPINMKSTATEKPWMPRLTIAVSRSLAQTTAPRPMTARAMTTHS